jgi:hypothetical protein
MRKDDKLIFCMPRKGDILGHAESTLWRKAAASPNCKASTSDEKAAWLHSVSHKCEHVGQSLFSRTRLSRVAQSPSQFIHFRISRAAAFLGSRYQKVS